jgi:predicted RNA polymerase sigma factor
LGGRSESRRVFAVISRLFGDFDTAEEALYAAYTAAMEQWGWDGVPANLRAWLVSTGRFKTSDITRRRTRTLDKKFQPVCRSAPAPFDALVEASHMKYRRTRDNDGKYQCHY